MKDKNLIIAFLAICLVISLIYIFAIRKSAAAIDNLAKSQVEYSEIARSFILEYNNMYRDQEHSDMSNLQNMCTEELWENYFKEIQPSSELPEKLEKNINNIEDIVCQVAIDGAKVVVHGTQSFEYTSYRFVYLVQINADKKVSAFNILTYSD